MVEARRVSMAEADPYLLFGLLGKQVIHPGGRKATEELLGLAALAPGQQVLDIGCGVGTTAIAMAKRFMVAVTAADVSADMRTELPFSGREWKIESWSKDQVVIVPNTAFHYAGVNILVNNASRLSGPYTVTALGDPSSLAGGLGNPDQLAELKSRTRIYRLGFSWLRSPRLSLPAFDATFLVKYAQPLG